MADERSQKTLYAIQVMRWSPQKHCWLPDSERPWSYCHADSAGDARMQFAASEGKLGYSSGLVAPVVGYGSSDDSGKILYV